jgi:hypothetical protein
MVVMKKNEWIKKLKPYWREYLKIEEDFHRRVRKLEDQMVKECKEPNIEFAYNKMCGGIELYFGVGFDRNFKKHELKLPDLIHGGDLE